QIVRQPDAPREPGERRRRLARDESLRRAALAFGRLGRDAYRPRSKLAQRSRQALGDRGDRAAMRQRRAVEIAEMRIVEVIVGDAEDDALARLANPLEHAPV